MQRILQLYRTRFTGWNVRHFYRFARREHDVRLSYSFVKLALQEAGLVRRGRARDLRGAPRVHAELAARGIHVGRKRVARLMRGAGVHGVSRRKQFRTTVRDETARPAPDLVDRQFAAAGPNRLWVADITYIATGAGFLFLAVVLDVWSRRVVGWAMAAHLRTELVMDALDMALRRRRPARR